MKANACACDIVDDCEPNSIYRGLMRKARKEHRCIECGEIIAPGQVYHYGCGLTDGRWWNAKTCASCQRISDDLFPCGYIVGSLDHDLIECYGVGLHRLLEEDA